MHYVDNGVLDVHFLQGKISLLLCVSVSPRLSSSLLVSPRLSTPHLPARTGARWVLPLAMHVELLLQVYLGLHRPIDFRREQVAVDGLLYFVERAL